MGLIHLVEDFCVGYYYTSKNLDQSLKEGRINAYSNEHYEEGEELRQNPVSAAGILTALLSNPCKTAKYFRQYLYPILEDRIVVLKEFKQYCKSRHLQI